MEVTAPLMASPALHIVPFSRQGFAASRSSFDGRGRVQPTPMPSRGFFTSFPTTPMNASSTTSPADDESLLSIAKTLLDGLVSARDGLRELDNHDWEPDEENWDLVMT